MNKSAWLVSISRGFGGDNAEYEERGDAIPKKISISVAWALGGRYQTTVFVDGERTHTFFDQGYIQPAKALSFLGYEVHGTVDFSACVEPETELLKNE